MLSVSNLTVEFGGKPLFEDISFLITPTDRIGLVGKNGAGKSTLLKILYGLHKPDGGTVSLQKDATTGYLPQDIIVKGGKTVMEETAMAFKEIQDLQKTIDRLQQEMETRQDFESDAFAQIMQDFLHAQERFHLLGGDNKESDIEQVLLGLGFKRSDFNRLTDEFSGGWRMRIELAKLLLQKPNILLLDEPTNHLDIESIQWLEEFLQNYYGGVVLISHDRAFLDNITKRTIEISMRKIYDYKANYSKYVVLRQERKEKQIAEQKNQDKYIEQSQMLINKFRAKNSKASFAQSLIKKLDKLERVEVDEDDTSAMRLRFPPAPEPGRVVIEADDLSKAYGAKSIFKNISFRIERGDRVAFAGKNGEGKTTLSQIIAGRESFSGHIKLGHNVSMGYYAQNQSDLLDMEKTVFQTVDDVASGEVRKQVRSLLGSFLFSGDDVEKKVKVLSGGEKGRLAMCLLLLTPHNLLVLDEPTNHLDLRSKDILKSALMNYNGTLVVVSHDRDFLQGLTNKVFEFGGGTIKQHFGDVYEFLRSRKIESLKELEKPKEIVKVEVEKPAQKEAGNSKRDQDKEQKAIRNKIDKSEKNIAKLEADIAEIDQKLLNPETYQQLINDQAFFGKYEQLKKDLEAEMNQWENLTISLSALEGSV